MKKILRMKNESQVRKIIKEYKVYNDGYTEDWFNRVRHFFGKPVIVDEEFPTKKILYVIFFTLGEVTSQSWDSIFFENVHKLEVI